MRPFGHLVPAEEARRRVLAATHPIQGAESLPIDAALGRVAARAYRAPRPVPSFARATWDGYAVRSGETRSASRGRPVRMRVVGELFAEDDLGRAVGPGEAVAIATGACLPRGVDAVVIFEDVDLRFGEIEIRAPVPRGHKIASAGDDFPRGATVVSRGETLTPAALGGLAAIGRSRVEVYRRPVVSIVPNGNELVEPGGRLRRGQIYESNNRTLAALVRAAGGSPRPVRPLRDDPERIEQALRRAIAGSDAVISTGGSSVGERDYLPTVFPAIGRLLFHGIAVRPGKPTLAATAHGKLLLGMPGHPTSCLSNGFWFLLPVLRKLARLSGPGWTDGSARLARPVPATPKGISVVTPLRVEEGWATPTLHDSSAITSLSGANAFALRPPGAPSIRRGDRLPVHFLVPPVANLPALD
jgi:molybdopterin molybdotransferase